MSLLKKVVIFPHKSLLNLISGHLTLSKFAPNPSRIHETTKNMILCKHLMFIFSLVPYFSRYCRSKSDYTRLSYRISFMGTCSPYARVSANFSKICTFLWPIFVAIKCITSVSAPISSSVLNNVSLKKAESPIFRLYPRRYIHFRDEINCLNIEN